MNIDTELAADDTPAICDSTAVRNAAAPASIAEDGECPAAIANFAVTGPVNSNPASERPSSATPENPEGFRVA